MIRILNESLQDVSDYLRSSDIKEELVEEIPEIMNDPGPYESKINELVVNLVVDRFPSEPTPKVVPVVVIKSFGDDSEVVSSDHEVIEFNGSLYDYTAHQFTDSYSDLINYQVIPVTQNVITNDSQINSGVSSVKSYALLKV